MESKWMQNFRKAAHQPIVIDENDTLAITGALYIIHHPENEDAQIALLAHMTGYEIKDLTNEIHFQREINIRRDHAI